MGNNKFIWRLGWETSVAVSRSSSKRGVKEFADKASDDQGGASQTVRNTDTAAYFGSSLGLTVPSVLRSPCVCCGGTLAVREREGEGCIFLQAGGDEGIL